MYGQLDLEVNSKLYELKKRLSNFHEFWSEELHCEKYPKIVHNL
jgi:hypothetical protein